MKIRHSILKENQKIQISGSKSISNRLLVLQKLFDGIKIDNLSNSQDSELMQAALESTENTIDIHHAGTAMRFLTSYFAIQEGKTTILTGSERMKQRPIKFLVDALRSLGAKIEYLENEGFPPLKITGVNIEKSLVKINANVSSQFITSLVLIGGKLKNGLNIELEGDITSRPYLEMTLQILSNLNIKNEFIGQNIRIHPFKKEERRSSQIHYEVESDWSSASYFYSMVAISRKTIALKSFNTYSLQGDSALKEIYWKFFGIDTVTDPSNHSITLYPDLGMGKPEHIELDMNDCPDIAQTLCVTAAALKIPFYITGLATLKVKETDRLVALKNELEKIGCSTEITENTIQSLAYSEPKEPINITTYNDHRMAMSFAPYSLIGDINIENPEVVEKSYPDFWNDFEKITNCLSEGFYNH